jgi:hypothetical protein
MSENLLSEGELVSLVALSECLGKPELARELATAVLFAEMPGTRIGVVGLVKRGKSSLINAIVGSDLSPVNLLPETSSVIAFASSENVGANGISEEGKHLLLSTTPSQFRRSVSRNSRPPLVAAKFRGSFEMPPDLWLIDTPGSYETDVAKKSLMTSGMPNSLYELCDGFVVVMGVPGVSGVDIELLQNLNSRLGNRNCPVVVIVKALDSSISFQQLKEYVQEVFSGSTNRIFVSSDENRSEINLLLTSFKDLKRRPFDEAKRLSENVLNSVKSDLRQILIQIDDEIELKFPKRLLGDLPSDVAELVKRRAPGAHSRRAREASVASMKSINESYQDALRTWSLRDDQLKVDVAMARRALTAAEKALKKNKPSVGCFPWLLFFFSWSFPPVAIVVGIWLYSSYGKEEEITSKNQPNLLASRDRALEKLTLAIELKKQHQVRKPQNPKDSGH